MKYVNIYDAKPGMILASTIYDNNFRVLLAANKTLSRCNIERLRKLKFQKIRVYESENETPNKSLLSNGAAVRKLDRIKVEGCLFGVNDITKDVLADNSGFTRSYRTLYNELA